MYFTDRKEFDRYFDASYGVDPKAALKDLVREANAIDPFAATDDLQTYRDWLGNKTVDLANRYFETDPKAAFEAVDKMLFLTRPGSEARHRVANTLIAFAGCLYALSPGVHCRVRRSAIMFGARRHPKGLVEKLQGPI